MIFQSLLVLLIQPIEICSPELMSLLANWQSIQIVDKKLQLPVQCLQSRRIFEHWLQMSQSAGGVGTNGSSKVSQHSRTSLTPLPLFA